MVLKKIGYFGLICWLGLASAANAMQCAPVEFEEAVANADVIFLGKITKRDSFNDGEKGICSEYSAKEPSCGSKVATFKVSKVWKGVIWDGSTTVYATDGCYCLGSYFEKGGQYIVFANKNSKMHSVRAEYDMGTVCDGTKGTPNAEESELKKKLDTHFGK